MNEKSLNDAYQAWPHRLAMLLVAATVTLIFVGGLVTTTESGMAVRDWPTSFGYGMFSFPIDQWLGNGWKVFIEHAHRLLGSTVGIITIAYLLALFRWDRRRWMWMLGGLTLAAVIFQGILGGTRVIENERTLAMIHGCFAPIFLSMCVSNAVFTSRRWQIAFSQVSESKQSAPMLEDPQLRARRGAFLWAACMLVAVSYLQIVLGAQLRHLPADASAATGVNMAILHVATACALALFIVGIGIAARRTFRSQDISARQQGQPITGVRKSAHWLGMLVLLQVVLGCSTWVFNYGWPTWFSGLATSEEMLILAQGFWQTFITTAHQTTGSVILAVGVALLWRSCAAIQIRASSIEQVSNGAIRNLSAPRNVLQQSSATPALIGGMQ